MRSPIFSPTKLNDIPGLYYSNWHYLYEGTKKMFSYWMRKVLKTLINTSTFEARNVEN